MPRFVPIAILAAFVSLSSVVAAPQLWVYASTNFQVGKKVDELIALMARAHKAGYDSIVINDFKFGRFEDRPDHFYRNLERVRKAADDIGITIIPGVMPIGYSSSLLINDPHLAAGIPVRDCLMTVKNGQGTVANTRNLLPGGDFERVQGNRPAGWGWVDGFGKSTFLDTKTRHSGKSALRMENFKAGNEVGNCRVSLKLKLKPWHQYRVTFWAKTDNLQTSEVKVLALAGGKSLTYTVPGVARNQDWRQHDVLFNSFEHNEVSFYIGIWAGTGGTMWLDEASVTEVAGINMLRREGCPVRVTSADGTTVFEEGRDFERWIYPKMGADPWPGSFKIVHPKPPLKLTKNSRIKGGQTLKVSFYHTVMINDHQVACCLIHDDIFTHLQEQVTNAKRYLRPKTYFMNHDEIRLAGHCALCQKSGKTAGQLLADNVRRCTKIIKSVDPEAEVIVWSDMFDPHHNARDNYYLVASTFAESWTGLDPKVMIANWNGGRKAQSLKFFADRGHRQIVAGYYDNPHVAPRLKQWTDHAKTGNVVGYMYTTWRHNYRDLETFAAEVKRQHKP